MAVSRALFNLSSNDNHRLSIWPLTLASDVGTSHDSLYVFFLCAVASADQPEDLLVRLSQRRLSIGWNQLALTPQTWPLIDLTPHGKQSPVSEVTAIRYKVTRRIYMT